MRLYAGMEIDQGRRDSHLAFASLKFFAHLCLLLIFSPLLNASYAPRAVSSWLPLTDSAPNLLTSLITCQNGALHLILKVECNTFKQRGKKEAMQNMSPSMESWIGCLRLIEAHSHKRVKCTLKFSLLNWQANVSHLKQWQTLHWWKECEHQVKTEKRYLLYCLWKVEPPCKYSRGSPQLSVVPCHLNLL